MVFSIELAVLVQASESSFPGLKRRSFGRLNFVYFVLRYTKFVNLIKKVVDNIQGK